MKYLVQLGGAVCGELAVVQLRSGLVLLVLQKKEARSKHRLWSTPARKHIWCAGKGGLARLTHHVGGVGGRRYCGHHHRHSSLHLIGKDGHVVHDLQSRVVRVNVSERLLGGRPRSAVAVLVGASRRSYLLLVRVGAEGGTDALHEANHLQAASFTGAHECGLGQEVGGSLLASLLGAAASLDAELEGDHLYTCKGEVGL
jgi:hypothetical protein